MTVIAFELPFEEHANRALSKITSALKSEKYAVQALDAKITRVHLDDEMYTYVIAAFEPLWFPIYHFTSYALIMGLALGFILGWWWSLWIPAIMAATSFFYSSAFFKGMFALWMRKAGYKKRLKWVAPTKAFKRYVDVWGNKKY